MANYLYLTEEFPPPYYGGALNYLRQILAGFGADEVTILTSSRNYDAVEESPYQPTVMRRKYLNWPTPKLLKPFVRLAWLLLWTLDSYLYIKKYKVRVVAAGQMYLAGVCAFALRKLTGKPYLVHIHGEEIENLLRTGKGKWLYVPVLKNADAIITVSNYTARRLEDLLKLSPPIHKVPNGVDAQIFRPSLDTQSLREQLGIKDEKIILQVGRMDVHKGQERVLRVLPDLLKSIPRLKYIIAGTGGQEKKLKQLIEELGLEEQVIFCGRVQQEELPRYYNLADVFAAPSELIPTSGYTEGFGIVLLEAAACGRPTVAGMAGGMVEAIVDEETGFLIPPEDDGLLLEALKLLLEDQELAKQMGAAGRQWAQQWSWESSRQKLKTILARYGERDAPTATG